MSAAAAPAPASRAIRRRGLLGWGIALIAVWVLGGLPAQIWLAHYAGSRPGPFGATVLALGAVLVVGVVCLVLGVRAERRARRTHRHDAAVAVALHSGLAAMTTRAPAEAYQPEVSSVVLDGARLIELADDVDDELVTAARGALVRRLLELGSTLSDGYQAGRAGWVDDPAATRASKVVATLTTVRVEPVVRSSLLDGAVSATVEAPGPAGERDTYRIVLAPSRGMRTWLQGLIDVLDDALGGEQTLAGATMIADGRRLVDRFAPTDTGYALDRLRALRRRPFAERDPAVIHGVSLGRNALLVTSLTLGRGGTPADLVPTGFPGLLGRTLAAALSRVARDDD